MHPSTTISPWTLEELTAYHAVLSGKPARNTVVPQFHCPVLTRVGDDPPDLPFPQTMRYDCEDAGEKQPDTPWTTAAALVVGCAAGAVIWCGVAWCVGRLAWMIGGK